MIQYVLCIAVDMDHEDVVLIRKLKPAFQKGKVNAPGGKVEADKDTPMVEGIFDMDSDVSEIISCMAQHAASREFMEETGVVSDPWAWKHVITLISGNLKRYEDQQNWEMFILFTDALDISQVKTMEVEEIFISPINELPDNIMPNLNWIIPLCLASHSFKETIIIRERE